MSWPANRATVYVYRMFENAQDQGALCATVVVDDYKHACGNARTVFVRDQKPPSGRYMVVTHEQNGKDHSCLIFEVKRAEYVIECNGVQDIVGADFDYPGRGPGSRPFWIDVDMVRLPDGDGVTP